MVSPGLFQATLGLSALPRAVYQGQITAFILFCNNYAMYLYHVTHHHIVAFVEFLAQNCLSFSSIATYISTFTLINLTPYHSLTKMWFYVDILFPNNSIQNNP